MQNTEKVITYPIIQKELEGQLESINMDFLKARDEGRLLEHISYDYHIVGEDEKGLPTDIVFSGGGPNSGLSLIEYPGVLWATNAGVEVTLPLSNELFEDIVLECRGELNYERK